MQFFCMRDPKCWIRIVSRCGGFRKWDRTRRKKRVDSTGSTQSFLFWLRFEKERRLSGIAPLSYLTLQRFEVELPNHQPPQVMLVIFPVSIGQSGARWRETKQMRKLCHLAAAIQLRRKEQRRRRRWDDEPMNGRRTNGRAL